MNAFPMPDMAAVAAQMLGIPTRIAKARTFATWTLNKTGGPSPRRALAATDLADAVALATPPAMPSAIMPKGGYDSFVILEADHAAPEGSPRLYMHVFTVKVRREWRGGKQLAVPYAVPAGSLPMDAFEPRRPFDALRDCAANGRQPGEGRLIEVSAR